MNFGLLLAVAGVFFLLAAVSLWCIPERDVQETRPHHLLVEGSDGFANGPRRARDSVRQDGAFRRMLLTRLLTGMDQMAFPFYTVFALNVLRLSPESVGVFVGAQTIGSLFGPLVFGRMAERAGPQRVIQLSALMQFSAPLLGLLFALLPGATSSIRLGIASAFIVAGLSMSSMSLGYFNYPLDWCPDQDRPTYVGLLSTAGAALMLAPVLGGLIVQYVSYGALFAVTALFVGAGVLAGLALPDKRMHHG
jgi:MFS family permease